MDYLNRKRFFRQTGDGDPGSVPERVLYRISFVRSLRRIWKKPVARLGTNRRIFDALVADWKIGVREQRYADGWALLSKFARGTLTGSKGITWWTDFNLSPRPIPVPKEVVRASHRIGITDDSLWVHGILLQLSMSHDFDLDVVRVPTPIDGFTQPVFLPSRERGSLDHGLVIDLSNLDNLRLGAKEFVAKSIDVKFVKFKPVLLNPRARKMPRILKHPSNLPFWQKLSDFYANFQE